MNTMHLFAGVGGGLLCDLILGHKPIIAVEWDKYACKILRERAADGWFPDLSVWEGDVRLFDPSEYTGKVDCIHAGFPCQDISVAGKQAGLGEGTRSGLYREVLRIAGVVQPRYLFLENVSAILSNGLGTVLGDLASMGYDCRWLCIRASDVGAPHWRDRWFLLANAQSSGDRRDSGKLSRSHEQEAPQRQEERVCKPINASEILADTRHTGICERGQSVNVGKDVQHTSGIYIDGLSRSCGKESQILADTECKRLQGQGEHERQVNSTQNYDREADRIFNNGQARQEWWELEPNIGRVASGVQHRVHRLKGLGNAQVPLQAALAWSLLMKLQKKRQLKR